MTKRLLVLLMPHVSRFPFPFPVLSAQKRAITIDDYLTLKSVGNPQLSPDGSGRLHRDRAFPQGQPRHHAYLARRRGERVGSPAHAGLGSDRQPRWSPDGRTLAFVSTRENGAQLWCSRSPGERGASRVSPTAVRSAVATRWHGLIVTSDIKWPPQQEIDRRNGEFPTDARLWTVSCGGTGRLRAASASTCSPSRSRTWHQGRDARGPRPAHDRDRRRRGRERSHRRKEDRGRHAWRFDVADNTNVDVYVMGADVPECAR